MRRNLLLGVVVLTLAACGKVNLYSNVTEQQANEMVALLLAARIDADKAPGENNVWIVKTPKVDLPRAVEVLGGYGYPREQYLSFGDVFKKEGFVSSPVEERARFLFAMSQELARTISAVDGVIIARVHIALPERDPLSDKVRPSSASVFIKHRPDVQLTNHVAQIKSMVVTSVEGLNYEKVTVSLFAADPWPFGVTRATAAAQDSGTGLMDNFSFRPGLMDNIWFYPAITASAALLLLWAAIVAWRRGVFAGLARFMRGSESGAVARQRTGTGDREPYDRTQSAS